MLTPHIAVDNKTPREQLLKIFNDPTAVVDVTKLDVTRIPANFRSSLYSKAPRFVAPHLRKQIPLESLWARLAADMNLPELRAAEVSIARLYGRAKKITLSHPKWKSWLSSPGQRPAKAQPATAQPATAQPATAQPATAQPATAQPATAQPATAQPATAQPATEKITGASLVRAVGSRGIFLPFATYVNLSGISIVDNFFAPKARYIDISNVVVSKDLRMRSVINEQLLLRLRKSGIIVVPAKTEVATETPGTTKIIDSEDLNLLNTTESPSYRSASRMQRFREDYLY